MKLKKKKKSVRMRGTRLHGWAAKKHKGSGNRGGKGMAGTGKRAGQRLSYIHRYLHPYFGKQGYTSRSTRRKKNESVNVSYIQKKYKPGEVSLEGYKILGEGEITSKFVIKAKSFSKQAKEKIEKAGGQVILLEKESKPKELKEESKVEVKKEKKEEKK
jgi:large subunit ribosomal protein L15